MKYSTLFTTFCIATIFTVFSLFADQEDPFANYPNLKAFLDYPTTNTQQCSSHFNGLPLTDKESIVEEIIQYTSETGCNIFGGNLSRWPKAVYMFVPNFAEKFDARLNDLGYFSSDISFYGACPLLTEQGISTNNINVFFPVAVKLHRKYNYWWEVRRQSTFGEFANLYAEHMSSHYWVSYRILSLKNNGINTIVDRAIPLIKIYLRKNGQSFIVKEDGINPVQIKVDEVIAALNAPKCNGLKELVERYDPDYEWIEPNWKSDEEIQKLRSDIFYGQVEFTEANATILRGALGLDEYNRFVEEYNQ